jgi:hypothetical protein
VADQPAQQYPMALCCERGNSRFHVACLVEARSMQEAMGYGFQIARQQWPMADGYHSHWACPGNPGLVIDPNNVPPLEPGF